MVALLLSILFTTSLGIILKLFASKNLDVFQAIVFNYISCVITGMVVQQSIPDYPLYTTQKWFVSAVILGCSFILFFNIMGFIVRKMGITVMSVSNKLSMVIPIGASIILFNENISILKIIGILLALCAVVFTSLKKEDNKHTFNIKLMFWPILLFVGSGMNDTIIKYAQVYQLTNNDNAPFNITIFSIASMVGFILLSHKIALNKSSFHLKSIIGGVLLGIPNYFSMHFLVKALSLSGYGGSFIFPLNNIGVVTLSAILAFFFFKEKLSALNIVGLVMALISFLIIAGSA